MLIQQQHPSNGVRQPNPPPLGPASPGGGGDAALTMVMMDPSTTSVKTYFLLILYPFRKFSTPKITSNFITQKYLEIGRDR